MDILLKIKHRLKEGVAGLLSEQHGAAAPHLLKTDVVERLANGRSLSKERRRHAKADRLSVQLLYPLIATHLNLGASASRAK